MTDVATSLVPSSGPPTSRSLPFPTPTSHSALVSLHAMSTRSSDALARRQSIHQQQQQLPPQRQNSLSPASLQYESHGLPSVEGRLARKRARSINVEEANHSRLNELGLHSAPTPPPSASNTDLICICPSPPKVPRPRNAFILYRQHHQADVVARNPGLANPEISKIIGEHWRSEKEASKTYWKRLAEEEKARHQRQYPQYKYQPRRGGKGGPAARTPSAAGEGGDPGRCPKCGGRYIATPRTPSTPWGLTGGPGGQGPTSSSSSSSSAAMMQPFMTNNPRAMDTGPPQHHPLHRQSIEAQLGGDPRRQSYYAQHHPEPMRPVDDDYDSMPPAMTRRRGPQQEDYDMMMASPDIKRRRFAHFERSPEHGSPMSAVPQQHQQHHHGMPSSQPPFNTQQHPHPLSRRNSSVSAASATPYPGPPPQMAPLPRPHLVGGPQQGMAPPPRPGPGPGPGSSASSRGNGVVVQQQQPAAAARGGFDESLTLAPLQIPTSPTQASERSGRSLSGGSSGLTAMMQQHRDRDSQARGIEAMVMSIPYMNKLDVLRKISPPLGPPPPGSPAVEARGPVVAIEGADAALMAGLRPVIERALTASGECAVRVWMDSTVEREQQQQQQQGVGGVVKRPAAVETEDVDMGEPSSSSSSPPPPSHEKPSGSVSDGPAAGAAAAVPGQGAAASGTFGYLQTIMEWHARSAEIIKHVTTKPTRPPNKDDDDDNADSKPPPTTTTSASSSSSSSALTPVALIPGGFSLTLSDRFASTVAITDPYSPVDHWQWMATLWRGIVGADLVVYVRAMTAADLEQAARHGGGGGGGTVEYRAPGVMVVRVAGDRADEKTERRLAFEVMEWVRAGGFREGYSFGGGGGGGGEGN